MALISGSHPWRKHYHLVGHGKGVGKIRNVHTSAFFLIIVLRGPCSALDVRSLASRRPRYEDLRSRDHRFRHWRAGGKLANACGRVVCSVGRSPSLRRNLRPPRLRSEESADERWGGDRRADAYARAWRHRRGADRLAQLDDV